MKAIILAAGVGKRFKEVTDHRPGATERIEDGLMDNLARGFEELAHLNGIVAHEAQFEVRGVAMMRNALGR